MNENIKILLDKVSADEALLAKFSACKSVDEAYELASGLVGGFTKEEFTEAMAAMSAAEDGNISDDDLAEAAGGTDPALSGFGQISELVSDTAHAVSDFVSDTAHKVADSYEDVAVSVTEFFADTKFADASKKAATEVGKYSKAVSKSVSKAVRAMAI